MSLWRYRWPCYGSGTPAGDAIADAEKPMRAPCKLLGGYRPTCMSAYPVKGGLNQNETFAYILRCLYWASTYQHLPQDQPWYPYVSMMLLYITDVYGVQWPWSRRISPKLMFSLTQAPVLKYPNECQGQILGLTPVIPMTCLFWPPSAIIRKHFERFLILALRSGYGSYFTALCILDHGVRRKPALGWHLASNFVNIKIVCSLKATFFNCGMLSKKDNGEILYRFKQNYLLISPDGVTKMSFKTWITKSKSHEMKNLK